MTGRTTSIGRWMALVAILAVAWPSAQSFGQDKKPGDREKLQVKKTKSRTTASDEKDKDKTDEPTRKAIRAKQNTVKAPATAPDGPHPVATFDSKDFDFGEVWVGPDLRHAFKITNTGDAPLHITKVRPG